ncbi:MAG: hypothetical protein ACOYI5_04970 [Christensenellales bacterium]|jgi:hypothetical protein
MKLSEIAKKMVRAILIMLLALIAGAILYYRSLAFLPFLYGALLGGAVSIAKVFLLDRAITSALGMEARAAGNYVRLQHLLRLLISGTALVVAALVKPISLWGAAAGVLTFQLAVYLLKAHKKS